jgi:regulator of protease activity HflC (stomatin/prohibitin superfamily)
MENRNYNEYENYRIPENSSSIISKEFMKYFCSCCCCCSCFISFLLIIFGFSSLEATEFGLNYSWISKSISPKVKENGLYFIGIGHSFIKFPKTVQTIEFSNQKTANKGPIQSRTSDGLEVTLEISFQYILNKDKIYELYSKYGKNYDYIFQNIAVHILTEEATKYTAYNFFMDRGKIKDDFQKELNEMFEELCYSNIQFLQLRSVDLPNLFEESIQESEVKKQDILRAKAEQNKIIIEVDTKIKAAEYQKDVIINMAEGEAEAIYKQNKADVESLMKMQETQVQVYKNLKNTLSLSNDKLLNLMKSKIIKGYNGEDNGLILNMNLPENIKDSQNDKNDKISDL